MGAAAIPIAVIAASTLASVVATKALTPPTPTPPPAEPLPTPPSTPELANPDIKEEIPSDLQLAKENTERRRNLQRLSSQTFKSVSTSNTNKQKSLLGG